MDGRAERLAPVARDAGRPPHRGARRPGERAGAPGGCGHDGGGRLDPRTRLAFGGPGDSYEREADGVADRLWATPSGVGAAVPRVRRFPGRPVGPETAVPASVDRVLAGPGRPLEPAVRRDVERRFGRDFSAVRVHTGPAAEQSAHDVHAHAYTVGRDIVFGAGQYAPDTARGRRVLAHELTHVAQQGPTVAAGDVAARLQRQSLSDVLETGAELAAGPVGGAFVRSRKQLIDDLVASVRESPSHVAEFFRDEVWQAIKDHWFRIMLVTGGIIGAELAVASLTAAPEPTMVTKLVAVLLQILIVAVLGYFATVEVTAAHQEGARWLAAGRQARGNPTIITEASRSFVRMVWHIVMAVLAVAGVRARVRGFTSSRGLAAGGGPGGGGGEVVPLSSHPRFRAVQPRSSPPTPGRPSASAFGPGGTARQLAPAEQPLPEAAPAVRAPAPLPAPGGAPGPGVQPVPALAAGLSAGLSPGRRSS